MIPTYTRAVRKSLIETFFGNNLVVALIDYEELGLSNSPTVEQLNARRDLDMSEVASREIGADSLNGYARYIVTIDKIDVIEIDGDSSQSETVAIFEAQGGDMDKFTHIVAVRSADLTNADSNLNGNNRGSAVGEVIFVEPTNSLDEPLIITSGSSFEYTFKLIASTELS